MSENLGFIQYFMIRQVVILQVFTTVLTTDMVCFKFEHMNEKNMINNNK